MGSCAAPSAKGDDKFITTDYLQQCRKSFLCILPRLILMYCRSMLHHDGGAGKDFKLPQF
ncbi:hypothetical protein F8926_23985 [Salmonella enterica]|nr:hypothetical protein [Salmonella enterica subsp. enterica serovar Kentucky]ECH6504260.1 hypothetical protein [Salmonella enterica subsp. enterica serovar Kentucky]ECR5718948.1 hypothetical protein [Salmonella enterica subsp. enterica serovar Kentucky]ECX9231987.1 hypothetical protein [Salmonella enterica subsp. enterica serovar Kentucky]ECY8386826.1 hypothetical protein [Salmonella enterica subsp. enterica serovar Kentucky]